ncbi:MAG: capsule assembly Wzi family protein [Candidatus Delongbacteria bacterium]
MTKIFLLLSLIIISAVYAAAPVMIPMTDKAAYDYIDYLNVSGVIDIPFPGIRPYRSDEIYKLLTSIENPDGRTKNFTERLFEKYIDKDNRFGLAESDNVTGWFDAYWNQSYVSQRASEKPLYKKLSMYHYLMPDYSRRGGKLDYDYPDISQHVTDGGLDVYLGYKDFLSLRTHSGVMINHSQENWMRDEFETLVLMPSGGKADFSSEDYTETSLLIAGENIDFTLGKYPLSMGAGKLNSLTLSPLDAYYENFMFSITGDKFKFATATGFLLADWQTRYEAEKPYYALTNETESWNWKYTKREKYLSAHRLEWRPFNNLNLGVNEMVIMGDRTIELGYLIPIVPLFWIEHYYGDHDNAAISFDLFYKPVKNLSVFGELLIDDESFTESWTEYYGNKWAISGGFSNTNFLWLKGLIFDFEYARVEPYVYGHKFHINRYMNLDYFLSIPAGPDSETLNYRLKYFLDFDKHVTLGFTRENRGEPLWGKWDAPVYDTDVKTFLRGTVEKKNNFYAALSFRLNKYLSAEVFYSHTNIENYNHNLPAYDDEWLEKYDYGYDIDIDHDGNMGENEDDDGDDISADDEHFQYNSYQHFYQREIVPQKVQQNYKNNTISLKLNMVFKNYFKDLF